MPKNLKPSIEFKFPGNSVGYQRKFNTAKTLFEFIKKQREYVNSIRNPREQHKRSDTADKQSGSYIYAAYESIFSEYDQAVRGLPTLENFQNVSEDSRDFRNYMERINTLKDWYARSYFPTSEAVAAQAIREAYEAEGPLGAAIELITRLPPDYNPARVPEAKKLIRESSLSAPYGLRRPEDWQRAEASDPLGFFGPLVMRESGVG